MKKNILKLIILTVLTLALIVSLASCASGEKVADDASGTWEGISWSYKKDGQTLTLNGTGEMKNATDANSIGWASIRNSVKKVIMADTLTSVGDYAFYGMSALETVELSENTAKIGKYAFSFCSYLAKLDLNEGITSVGESAFEGCRGLKSVKLPSTLTKLDSRAFAFCRSLESVLIPSAVEKIGSWTFKECEKLSVVALNSTVTDIAADAFEDAAIGKDKIKPITATGNTTIKVFYVDTEGKTLKDPKTEESKAFGDAYSIVAAAIDGYTVEGKQSYTGVAMGEEVLEFTFKYKKNAQTSVTTTPDTDKNNGGNQKSEGIEPSTIVALCIFGVVIIGVCVGAFLVIRSDRKRDRNSTTVRKNNTNAKKKK